jgi:hypothetical protein
LFERWARQFVHRFFKPNPFLHDVGLVSSSC